MAKLLFFAHDPGGANTLYPLLKPLSERGHELLIYGKGPALKILPKVTEYNGDTDELIKKTMPDFVLTGTSFSDMTEKQIRKSAKRYNIKSLSILDQWVNYNRFTKYPCDELNQMDQTPDLEYISDHIIVMDDYAKQEMIKEGVPADIIYDLGNPHFVYIKEQIQNLEVKNLRTSLLKDKSKLVIYASCAEYTDNKTHADREVVYDILDVLPDDVQFVIKPHPRDVKGYFDEFKDRAIIIEDVKSQEIIKASDLVISIASMLLTESLIMGKPTISYQPMSHDKNEYILTKNDFLPFINNKTELKNEIIKCLKQEKCENNFTFKPNAIENIIKFIEEKLCQN